MWAVPLLALVGVVHVHHSPSHDSEAPFSEVVEAARSAGLDFVVLTEHVDSTEDVPLPAGERAGTYAGEGKPLLVLVDRAKAESLEAFIAEEGMRVADELHADDVAKIRDQMTKRGNPVGNLPDNVIRGAIKQRGEDFRDNAPTTPVQAAAIILDGVRQDRWRILVGEDAHVLDDRVRATPEQVYEAEFTQGLYADGHLTFTRKR